MSKQVEMKEILSAIQLPTKLTNNRTVLTVLAIAGLREKDSWTKVIEEYKRTNDIIQFINQYYPNKGGTAKTPYAPNTRETIRDDSIAPLCDLAILEQNGAKSQSGNHGYRLTKETANLFRSYGTDEWNDELEFFLSTHKTYSQLYQQARNVDKGLPVQFDGHTFSLVRNPHNKLQIDILSQFAPRFVPNAKLLYIGDTKKRKIVEDKELFAELNLPSIDYSIMPDIVLYSEARKWLLFIEAYTSTGEMSAERVSKIRRYCSSVDSSIQRIFVTAFPTMAKCKAKLLNIAWETEVWVAEEPDHMIHLDGIKFISGYGVDD